MIYIRVPTSRVDLIATSKNPFSQTPIFSDFSSSVLQQLEGDLNMKKQLGQYNNIHGRQHSANTSYYIHMDRIFLRFFMIPTSSVDLIVATPPKFPFHSTPYCVIFTFSYCIISLKIILIWRNSLLWWYIVYTISTRLNKINIFYSYGQDFSDDLYYGTYKYGRPNSLH